MQYLKEDIRQKIIRSALLEFSEKGYQKASMRNIAARAEIVSGNIYRYFKNKEDLFDSTVGPAYDIIQELKKNYFKAFEDAPDEIALFGMFDDVRTEIMKILEAVLELNAEILILLENSAGTKYAGCKDEIKQAVTDVLSGQYKRELLKKGIEPENDRIFEIIASSLIDGICLIIKKGEKAEIANLISRWHDIIFKDLHGRIG